MAPQHETGLVICVTGPESTGKTTLAWALAEALGAPLVEEVARAYLTERRSDLPIATVNSGIVNAGVQNAGFQNVGTRNAGIASSGIASTEIASSGIAIGRSLLRGYSREDVLAIARLQVAAERAALETGAPVVVADTDLTVIQVWWEEKYGELDPWIRAALAERSRRHYLLTLPDLPWEPDPLRESPHDRERLLVQYRAVLADARFLFGEVSGLGAARLAQALSLVESWLPPL